MNNPEIFVDTNFAWNSIDLRIRVGRQIINGDVVKRGDWMKEPLFVKVEDGATPPVAMRLEHLEAQALMDRLWKAGLRPTEGSGSAGALAATQDHLKDMRRLVFDCPDPKPSIGRAFTPEQERKIFDP
jgi:hypothetical protein